MSVTTSALQPSQVENLTMAGTTVDRHLTQESSYPSLVEITKVSPQCLQNASGLSDPDYMPLDNAISGLQIGQIQTVARIPLPREITEHVRASHYSSMQGIFPEIKRAWMTIDSDFYLWTYEQTSDTAYYDRLTEVITGVALVKPRKGVFQSFVRHLLILSTSVEVVILGMTYAPSGQGHLINLIHEPIFQIPSDGIVIATTVGSDDGRIFQGGDDGSLYEIVYQGNEGWFGKKCKRINHSQSVVSYLVPSFLNFSERDAVVQIEIDNSRQLLYTLTKKGTIRVYHMSDTPGSVRLFYSLTEASIVQQSLRIVRTLEGGFFHPIVGIQAIQRSDSPQLHMVAVTSSGVRLYFTTLAWNAVIPQQQVQPITPTSIGGGSGTGTSYSAPPAVPHLLHMVHIRLPPGYTAQAHAQPRNVEKIHYRRGTFLMVSKFADRSIISCLSRDLCSWSPMFTETETQLQTDAHVFALLECPSNIKSNSSFGDPPPIVTEHMEHPTKYVSLTSQGVQIHTKLRPCDLLKAALLGLGGAESNAVKSFFNFLGDEQACAIALQLACLESTNVELMDAATRAFIFYGSYAINQPQVAISPIQFNPSNVSTPISSRTNINNSTFTVPNRQFSAKHDGMYLFLSRILRPIWHVKASEQMVTDNKKYVLLSGVDGELLAAICTYLEALKNFLQRNATLILRAFAQNQNETTNENAEERRSLIALRQLVSHSLEILSLWRVLCEHQFHVLADKLTNDQKSKLCSTSFKDLILSGQDLCGALVNSLITLYLEDNANVDALSAKLRDVCPTLYRQEDVACSKANEILRKAHDENDNNERKRMLNTALTLLQQAAPHVNLSAACQQFASCHYYEGVTKLSVICAKSTDPQDFAVHYYVNKEPPSNVQGGQAFGRRMECYKETINILDNLFNQPESEHHGRNLLRICLLQDDYLLRVAVYEWLVRRHLLQSELLERNDILVNNNNAPEGTTLQNYLERMVANNPHDRSTAELLWTMYEKTGQHYAAAKVMQKLAQSPGETIPLNERLFCLSRAILCMRSETVGYSHATGNMARELEDQAEVLKLQTRILEQILSTKITISPQSLSRLSNSLVSISDLYEDYAVPLHLHESQLDIMYCSTNLDPAKVMEIWSNLIPAEVAKTPRGTDRMILVLQKVEALGKRYGENRQMFPLDFLIRELELHACREHSAPGQVHRVFLNCGFRAQDILDAYCNLMPQSEWTWGARGNEWHIVDALAALVSDLLANRGALLPHTGQQRREAITVCADTITVCLNNLYTKVQSEVKQRVDRFKDLQARCEHLSQLGG